MQSGNRGVPAGGRDHRRCQVREMRVCNSSWNPFWVSAQERSGCIVPGWQAGYKRHTPAVQYHVSEIMDMSVKTLGFDIFIFGVVASVIKVKKSAKKSWLFCRCALSYRSAWESALESAVVAELAYAHDSGSCPYYLGAGSSPANCTKKRQACLRQVCLFFSRINIARLIFSITFWFRLNFGINKKFVQDLRFYQRWSIVILRLFWYPYIQRGKNQWSC